MRNTNISQQRASTFIQMSDSFTVMHENRYRNNPRRDSRPRRPLPEPAKKSIGEVVTAKVRNPNENQNSGGKPRPAILLEEVGGQFDLMGLSEKDEYASGANRTRITDYRALGLETQGHYWGDKTTRVSRADIGDHIGWVTHSALDELQRLGLALSESTWKTLRACADARHPGGNPREQRGT